MSEQIEAAARVLVAHQRHRSASCLCGWAELGRSHAAHQVEALREVFAGVWDEGYGQAQRDHLTRAGTVNPYREEP